MIRFSKFMLVYFFLSALVLVPGMYSLVRFGLKPAIDFTGGTLLELRFDKDITAAEIQKIVAADKIQIANIQQTSSKSYILRLKQDATDAGTAVTQSLARQRLSGTVIRNETVGPVLGKELLGKTKTAAIFAIIMILLYVAYAFKDLKFGAAAVIALVHDLLVVLGVFSLLGHFKGIEVDTLFVTAFLTTMSFSVHDTIVVFDRIREMLRRGERLSFEQLADKALTETMHRSVTNSLTIIFMLLALVLLGGETIRWFAMALLVGTVSGTYSSPFIATPVLILWDKLERRRKDLRFKK